MAVHDPPTYEYFVQLSCLAKGAETFFWILVAKCYMHREQYEIGRYLLIPIHYCIVEISFSLCT